MQVKNQIRLVMILGILSLVVSMLAHLALTDIYHAEGDLRLEWTMLRVFALIYLAFLGSTLITLYNIRKHI
jgi:hypothetical protein